ncbi:hypothetical protein QT995_02860 [Microcoleus sp. S36b_A3]|uniref:hypothetical protein n=1 Tax=Microcoleaceae TaxID=1892252 RepID=UPI00187EF536|nr:hypothetical protein [Tychonema sp. LEGE 06208]MBE9161733.1 hypothetical protein [Tychonema sp. LEGE 06208]
MKDEFDDKERNFSPGDRSNAIFGRTELYLLLLLFVGGITIDYWFRHHPQQLWRSPTEQPAGLSPPSPKPLL